MIPPRKPLPKARQRRQHPNNRRRHKQTLIPAFTDDYNEVAIKGLFDTRKTGEKWGC